MYCEPVFQFIRTQNVLLLSAYTLYINIISNPIEHEKAKKSCLILYLDTPKLTRYVLLQRQKRAVGSSTLPLLPLTGTPCHLDLGPSGSYHDSQGRG